MARLIRTATRTLFSSFSSSTSSLLQSRNAITSSFLFQSPRPYSAENKITKSPFEANILRIIDKEIDYQSEYAPPYQVLSIFKSLCCFKFLRFADEYLLGSCLVAEKMNKKLT
jgi:complement component 1 Q subcomponent-binding protein